MRLLSRHAGQSVAGRRAREAARSRRRAPVAVLALLATLQGPADAAPQPLFDDEAPLAITLALSSSALRASRASGEPFPATLSYGAGEDRADLDVQLALRGHSRRELCEMPPLKLDFRRGQLDGTVFEGQNKLKLVTHCMDDARFQRYLLQEYAVYRSYAALTQDAFRVRLLEVRYVDPDGFMRERVKPAFLIEDDGRVAERLGYTEVEIPRLDPRQLDPDAITLFGLFQFMIGNTDWSLLKGRGDSDCCHNGLLLQKPDASLVIVPYDFDQAGVVNADYALPAEGLGLRSVRQRLFRGLCTGDARLEAAIARVNGAREHIEGYFPLEGRMKAANRRSLRYLDDFYAIANDAAERERWIGATCRGDESLWSTSD